MKHVIVIRGSGRLSQTAVDLLVSASRDRLLHASWFAGLSLIASVWVVVSSGSPSIASDSVVLDPRLHHLRIEAPREWSDFPERAEAPFLEIQFRAETNSTEQTLSLRQQDVKQRWLVLLNGKQVGRLRVDENDMVVFLPIPAGTLVSGPNNRLRIEQDVGRRAVPDDIRVGEIALDSRAMSHVLNESSVQIEVVDGATEQLLPARITIVDRDGVLQTTGASSDDQLAVRPGIVYTSTGRARIGLPAGRYKIYAGRGFEYSLDSVDVTLAAGETVQRRLSIRREVPTEGYAACDTHVHTLTHSGHGDATVNERMITLAAEGLELPIATDHNVHIDHHPFASKQHVRQYFTPVIGNEVSTRVGHFNVFPVMAGAKPPNHRLADWKSIFADIYRTPGVKAVILNHGRDLHGGTRPLGPKLHNDVVGENLAGWPPGMNAMEVVNSGATQTDVMQLFHDWMGLLNRGRTITPVGSSDSHDVARHFVGQGRTYIRCDDRDPGNIDVSQAVDSFIAGRVMVSYGLLAELTVNDKYKSGELARTGGDRVEVAVRVLGPHWVEATRVRLFANGRQIRAEDISPDRPPDLPPGIKWERHWEIPVPKHDVHLVAIATGPGIDGPYWKSAKPYQPTSPEWEPRVVGCSGAIWLDADGDGRKTSAQEYASRLRAKSGDNLEQLIASLSDYDRAVAAQAAHLYQLSGESWFTPAAQAALKKATKESQHGVQMYLEAWRANQIAQREG